MEKLSIKTLNNLKHTEGFSVPSTEIINLPEKVLQFGTGVLLRGLPDYFIDAANKQGKFNGRVVVVKSTASGDLEAFKQQDGLYTHCIRGLENNNKIEKNIINASISRALSAADEWEEILACAADPNMQIVVSNTTEVGIQLVKDDKIDAAPPASFPGKLLAFLHARYKAFNGNPAKGLVIIPTELIVNNGEKLASIVMDLAKLNGVDQAFLDWLSAANHFCSSLVDRIVPGKLAPAESAAFIERYQYTDDLLITSESYSLWAIEASPEIAKTLSFAGADKGVVIAEDITKFRELKLRLLNGSHTFTCGLAHLAGYETVKQAMDSREIEGFISELMFREIAPSIVGHDLSHEEAKEFGEKVLDRFRNPFIEHRWLSITVQYSSKMRMRNLPLLLKHYERTGAVPKAMALGFAAYILFMRCSEKNGVFTGNANGKSYTIQDDHAGWFAEREQSGGKELVKAVLSNTAYWGHDLTQLPGFLNAVTDKFEKLVNGEVSQAIQESCS